MVYSIPLHSAPELGLLLLNVKLASSKAHLIHNLIMDKGASLVHMEFGWMQRGDFSLSKMYPLGF